MRGRNEASARREPTVSPPQTLAARRVAPVTLMCGLAPFHVRGRDVSRLRPCGTATENITRIGTHPAKAYVRFGLSFQWVAPSYQLRCTGRPFTGPELVQPFGLSQHILHNGVAVHITGFKRASSECGAHLLHFNFPELDHLRLAFWAPSANDGMNATAADAKYVERAAKRIWFTLLTPLGRVIFDHHDDVHSSVAPHFLRRRELNGALVCWLRSRPPAWGVLSASPRVIFRKGV